MVVCWTFIFFSINREYRSGIPNSHYSLETCVVSWCLQLYLRFPRFLRMPLWIKIVDFFKLFSLKRKKFFINSNNSFCDNQKYNYGSEVQSVSIISISFLVRWISFSLFNNLWGDSWGDGDTFVINFKSGYEILNIRFWFHTHNTLLRYTLRQMLLFYQFKKFRLDYCCTGCQQYNLLIVVPVLQYLLSG